MEIFANGEKIKLVAEEKYKENMMNFEGTSYLNNHQINLSQIWNGRCPPSGIFCRKFAYFRLAITEVQRRENNIFLVSI